MHLGLESLARFYSDRHDTERLVLATVVETAGSTYRKPGALMLLSESGAHGGLVSGGCLEGDLAGHAVAVFREARPRLVRYDLHDDPELVMGLGLGCGGDLLIQLWPVFVGDGSRVLEAAFQAAEKGEACRLLQRVTSETSGHDQSASAGLALVRDNGSVIGDADIARAWDCVEKPDIDSQARLGAPRTRRCGVNIDGAEADLLAIDITPPPLVLVCGAGPDAVPVAEQVRALGWRCRVVDHRGAFAQVSRFPAGTDVIRQRPEALNVMQLDGVTAAVVMSHHVGHDLAYLRALAAAPPTWVGLLGPSRRRKTLLEQLGDMELNVFGPAGLDIGAELPASVALSIVAAIHAHLNGRDGGVLGEH